MKIKINKNIKIPEIIFSSLNLVIRKILIGITSKLLVKEEACA
jgi:hypothetical protein